MHFGDQIARYSAREIAYWFVAIFILETSPDLYPESVLQDVSLENVRKSSLFFFFHDVRLFDAIGELCKMFINAGNNNLGVDAIVHIGSLVF